MDNLEEYMRKHREELDRYRPSSGIWKRIRKELGSGRAQVYRWVSVAAIFTVVLGTALVFFGPGYKLSGKKDMGIRNTVVLQVNSQLRETEIYYNNLANTLYREATPMLAKNPEIEKELFMDISHLDSICSVIKKDLKDNIANQDVIEALIQNYRIKIRLLEDMLETLKENEDNEGKNNSHEL